MEPPTPRAALHALLVRGERRLASPCGAPCKAVSDACSFLLLGVRAKGWHPACVRCINHLLPPAVWGQLSLASFTSSGPTLAVMSKRFMGQLLQLEQGCCAIASQCVVWLPLRRSGLEIPYHQRASRGSGRTGLLRACRLGGATPEAAREAGSRVR